MKDDKAGLKAIIRPNTTVISGQINTSGKAGKDGATFIPSIDKESGVLSWTNNKGLENPEPVKIRESIFYGDHPDKPRINGIELKGNLSFEDLGLRELTPQEIDQIMTN